MDTHHHPICPCCIHGAGNRPCSQLCYWAGNSNENLFTPIRPTKAERKEMKEKKARKKQKLQKKNTRDYENVRRNPRALPKR